MNEMISKLWQKLSTEAEVVSKQKIVELFDEQRAEVMSLAANGLFIDFSKNKLTETAKQLLLDLAEHSGLAREIQALFNGEKINTTEQRAVMHHLLRAESSELPEWQYVLEQKQKASAFAEKLRRGELKGATGQVIDTVVNIGIGGSDLGPQLLIDAFKHQIPQQLNVYFISDVDYSEASHLLSSINLETTLFILCSKSFTTWETQTNAQLAITALKQVVGEQGWPQHFAGVAVDQQAMTRFGILPEHQFLIWDWVGGRYSVWSSIGLVARIALGNEIFEQFLAGARQMDQHFREAPFATNLPVMLALVQIWNINFMHHSVFITLPYRHALKLFPDYQQQLEMESNGKSVDKQGQFVSYSTCPYIFGQLGLNAQHAFMQLVHQSAHKSYLEFIAVPESSVPFEQDVAFRSCLAQASALMKGTGDQVASEKYCPGDRPSTLIVLDEMTPHSLGRLLALYEQKVFVQSVIWNINAFDQFGVELGKQIAKSLNLASIDDPQLDGSTRMLLQKFGRSSS
jgi:glucose-6-phosphate isomerase